MQEDPHFKAVTLAALAEGALGERFDLALEDARKNIRDPNTKPTAKRKIVIEVTLQPNEDRETIVATFDVRTSMATLKPYQMPLFVGTENGRAAIVAIAPQREIPLTGIAGTITPREKAANE
jgi:hypothetical protein